ncbi:MAG: hypothetical protein AAF628_16895 [Planctomycetota bacterium]
MTRIAPWSRTAASTTPATASLAAVLLSTCAMPPRATPGGARWSYDARVDPALRSLAVDATLWPKPEGGITVARTAHHRIVRPRAWRNDGWVELPPQPDGWELPAGVNEPVRLRYAVTLPDVGETEPHWLPLGAWLLRPPAPGAGATVTFSVDTPDGVEFATGVRRVATRGTPRYALPADTVPYAPQVALGRFRTAAVETSGGRVIEVLRTGDVGTVPEAELLAWVQRSADAVAGYFGRFPVPRVLLHVPIAPGTQPMSAMTFGLGGALIEAPLNAGVSTSTLRRDWILPHEMVHLAVPSLPSAHHWLEEGVATYVEAVARVRAGLRDRRAFWRELRHRLPQGQPQAGDRGLNRTHTWARTYWGGALYCFIADVEIRRRTAGQHGLEHALRGVLAAGGSIETIWPIERLLQAADDAVGAPVLMELYRDWAWKPVRVDLTTLWRDLGVRGSGRRVTLSDTAPLSAVRRAIDGSR